MPKISVLSSVHNGKKYLQLAIESILKQTYKDFEFLIIDDCSTDESLKVIRSYNDSRIKIIRNKKNIGLTKSLNIGIKIAKGEYIARMDADDISVRTRLEKEVKFLDRNSEYAAVGSFAKIIDKNSRLVRLERWPTQNSKIKRLLMLNTSFTHGSVMIRKKCLEAVNYYDASFKRSQDYDLWLRLSERFPMANLPEYLYLWREHPESICGKNDNDQTYVKIAKRKAQIRLQHQLLQTIKNSPFCFMEIYEILSRIVFLIYIGKVLEFVGDVRKELVITKQKIFSQGKITA